MATTFRRKQGDESVEITFLDKNLGLKVETTNTRDGWLDFFEKRNNNVCFPVTCKGGSFWKNCTPVMMGAMVNSGYSNYCKKHVLAELFKKIASDTESKSFTVIQEEYENGNSMVSLKKDNGEAEEITKCNIIGCWRSPEYLKRALIMIRNMNKVGETVEEEQYLRF